MSACGPRRVAQRNVAAGLASCLRARPDQRVRPGVPGRCRLRRRRCGSVSRGDQHDGQPRALDGRPQRRAGSRSRRRLTHPHGSASARLSGLPRVLAQPPRNSASERFQPSAAVTSATATPQPPCASGRGPRSRRTPNSATPRTRFAAERERAPGASLGSTQELERRISSLLLCRHDEHPGVGARRPATRGQESSVPPRGRAPACGFAHGAEREPPRRQGVSPPSLSAR